MHKVISKKRGSKREKKNIMVIVFRSAHKTSFVYERKIGQKGEEKWFGGAL